MSFISGCRTGDKMNYETIKQVLDSHKNEKLTDKTIKQIMEDISTSSLFEDD